MYFLWRFVVLLAVAYNGVTAKEEDSLKNRYYQVHRTPPINESNLLCSLDQSKCPTTSSNSAITSESLDCECHPYYLCNKDRVLKTSGEYIQDLRVQGTPGSPCNRSTDICCRRPDVLNDAIPPPSEPPLSSDCGVRNEKGVSGLRIRGDGNEAQFGEFPWVVAITKWNNDRYEYVGAGSLIRPNVVVTAAHTVQNITHALLTVVAGEWDTKVNNEPLPAEALNVRKKVMHERYSRATVFNDIALLFLESSFNLTRNIGLVCLPEQGAEFDGANCFANGWGKDIYGKNGTHQQVMKKVELPTVPHLECQKALREARMGPVFELHSSFMCAGGVKGRDVCQGDGGGPLTCLGPDRKSYVQAGIVSWGIGCNTATPGVYVKVSQFRNWIDEKIEEERNY